MRVCLCQCVSALNLISDVVRPHRARARVCSRLLHWHRTGSGGKHSISSERFQAWSAMKAQLRDVRSSARTTANALPLIITLYQSMSRLAIFLSVSFPSFSLWNLSIYLSFSFHSFCIHPTPSPLGSSQAASVGSALCSVLFLGGLFLDGWALTGSYGSFRSSHLRCPSHVPEEPGWCKPWTDFSTWPPPQRSHMHTCSTHAYLLTPGISFWQLTVYSRRTCSLDLHSQQQTAPQFLAMIRSS